MTGVHAGTQGVSKEQAAKSGVYAGLLDTLVAAVALLLADSVVVLADFMKTGLEFVAVLLSWLALKRVARGGHQYEYGLDKLENLSGLMVALLMVGCLVSIGAGAILDILEPEPVTGVGIYISLAAQVVFGFVNWRVYLQARQQAKASPLASSQARLFFTRLIGNAFVLVALSSSLSLHHYEWAQYIDPVASLMIATSILLAAVGVLKSSVFDLLDRSLEEDEQIRILAALVLHFHDFDHLHGIRTRRAGGRTFIEVFLEFNSALTMGVVQKTVNNLQSRLEQAVPGAQVSIGLADRKVI